MHFENSPHDRHASVCTVAMPKDTNAIGDIFGGWLMSNADVAGAILAYRRAGGRVVTVAVNEFLFLAPVLVGDIVSFYTDVARVGRTSITIDISMFADRDWGKSGVIRVATATITYVHIGPSRRPEPISSSTTRRRKPPKRRSASPKRKSS